MKICLAICMAILLIPYSVAAAGIPVMIENVNNHNAASDSDSFSFVVWGHPRGAHDGSPQLYLEEILERIADLDPDLLIITGDMISGGASRSKLLDPAIILSDWENFDKRLNELGIPVLRTPGNHDVNNFTTRDIYLKRYRKPPYAVTVRGSRLIFLDSVGIDQRKNDQGRYWSFQGLPFDEAQIDFVKKELANQDNFDHLFFFWHHTRFWSDSGSSWWKDVHPRLKGGKTRAIFTGDPIQKYLYENYDGIHYIASAVFETPEIKWLYRHPETKPGWGTFTQLDNIQYAVVSKESLSFQTIVVGATQNKGLSPRYWESYEANLNWRQRLAETFKSYINRFRHLVFFAGVWGIFWVSMGITIGYVWFRFKRQRTRK